MRGFLLARVAGRVKREIQSLMTTTLLSLVRPQNGILTVATLNADEENASVQAVLLGRRPDVTRVTLVTPSPSDSKFAVAAAAKRLDLPVPQNLDYRRLSYLALLRGYSNSEETYSTHVLLPGRDMSHRRRHVHLTHGSGPKPDTTFRGPTNVLASITPQWVKQQLQEYKLPADTEVIHYMPRLEIMRRAAGDESIATRLGLPAATRFVVWAPTYRAIRRGKELRVSGAPFSSAGMGVPDAVRAAARERGAELLIKAHPHDADDYTGLGPRVLTNTTLRQLGVTSYELFGAASLVITDYSSIYIERASLGLDYLLVQPDRELFLTSYRGLRKDS